MTQEREAFEAWAKQYGRIFLNTKPKLGRGGVMYENQFTQEAWVGWQARASLAQPASVPAGRKLVPVEPTLAMLDALRADTTPYLPDRYRAMLAAAPQAPQPAQATADAVQAVIRAMRSDPDYAWSWHCNVAMSFVDAGGDRYTANQGAARFMRLLAGVDPAYPLPAAPQPEAQPRNGFAQRLADELFDLGSLDSGTPCGRIQFMCGDWPDNERPGGGLNKEAFTRFIERVISTAAPSAQAPQPEAQPPGFALVQIAELTEWKSLANSLAVLSLKSERATTAIILKSLIQDAIDAAPSAQAEQGGK